MTQTGRPDGSQTGTTRGGHSRGEVPCRLPKAVITAAGRAARQYPASDTVQKAMLPIVDRDGLTKPVLQIIAEEAIESGIEEICVVSAPETRRSTAATFAIMRPT